MSDAASGQAQMTVYLLWHARHIAYEEDEEVVHRDSDGSLHLDEEEWRVLGVYSDIQRAEARRDAARALPGFREEPDCFEISPLDVDEQAWLDGFFTDYPDGTIRE